MYINIYVVHTQILSAKIDFLHRRGLPFSKHKLKRIAWWCPSFQELWDPWYKHQIPRLSCAIGSLKGKRATFCLEGILQEKAFQKPLVWTTWSLISIRAEFRSQLHLILWTLSFTWGFCTLSALHPPGGSKVTFPICHHLPKPRSS